MGESNAERERARAAMEMSFFGVRQEGADRTFPPTRAQLEGGAFPKNATESRARGFTGDGCEGCGQLTLTLKENHSHKFTECAHCGHRVTLGPKPVST